MLIKWTQIDERADVLLWVTSWKKYFFHYMHYVTLNICPRLMEEKGYCLLLLAKAGVSCFCVTCCFSWYCSAFLFISLDMDHTTVLSDLWYLRNLIHPRCNVVFSAFLPLPSPYLPAPINKGNVLKRQVCRFSKLQIGPSKFMKYRRAPSCEEKHDHSLHS